MESWIRCGILSLGQATNVVFNGAYICEALRSRHTSENRCHFITHSVFFCLINLFIAAYQLLIVNNPIWPVKEVHADDADSSNADIMWAVGVGLSIAQYIGFLILVTNRMVTLSFQGEMLDKVWSGRVCGFLLFTQFLFPVAYVGSVIYDEPGLYIARSSDDILKIRWTDDNLQLEYNALSQIILIVVVASCGIAFAVVGILHVLRLDPEDETSSPQPRDITMRELEWIVETTSLGSTEDHTSSIGPRDTSSSSQCPSGFHITVFLFFNYIFLSLEAAFTIVFMALPPTSAIFLGNLASLSFPFLMLGYWYGRTLITPWTYRRRDGTVRFWLYRLRQSCYNPDPQFRQFSDSDHTVFSTPHSSESTGTQTYPANFILQRSMSISQYTLIAARRAKAHEYRDSYLHRTMSLYQCHHL
ncbi:hypothetical protein QR680_019238 [Steinernema hermaphroditum]|uniref:Uncharacterized protein n=1 Tax=Steinernema hermaphroditum TaxID=289476 RepID=A0AA39HML9_9BILA|nr:hypothetical protein QR680_019238 [Steinernema hermaphroditum]